MTAFGLTPRQHDLMTVICAFERDHGHMPSFAEMKEAMGLSSTSGIHRLVVALEERGLIERIPNRARCIKLLVAA